MCEAMPKNEMEKAKEDLLTIRQSLVNIAIKVPGGTDLYRSLSKSIDRVTDAINDIYRETQWSTASH
jgi:hypothetical protein